ncbi:alkylphosphonate utilization protein [Arthrobacter sp. ERGS1:01]|uniref:alkylphosphonate utilization protein n=1 Tax=Arthrobacter sp. ERGS1:01 TaxID=1704044 RepID=UPI00307C20D0
MRPRMGPGRDAEVSGDVAEAVIKDAVGNVLADGDTVSIVKTMKVKGSPQGLKAGTKVRNIRLVTPVDGHDIDAKIEGFGPMKLKSSVVKKI